MAGFPQTPVSQAPNTGNQGVVNGGVNMYGFTVPNDILQRNVDGTLNSNYAVGMGSNAQAIQDYGNTMGSPLDPNSAVNMGSAYQNLNNQANSVGDLASTAAMRQQANIATQGALNGSNASASSGLANTMSQMAQNGGVDSGANERMGNIANTNAMMANQGIMAQNRDQNLNLDLQNAQAKNSMLTQVGNVQQANNTLNANAYTQQNTQKLNALQNASNVQQAVNTSNVGAMRSDLTAQNNAAMSNYQTQMGAYGADKTAQAQAMAGSAGSGGLSVICTELYVQGKLSRDEFLKANQYGLTLSPETYMGYLTIAKPIVKLMTKSDKFSNLFINWARALGRKEPNLFTRCMFPVANIIGHIKLKLQPNFLKICKA